MDKDEAIRKARQYLNTTSLFLEYESAYLFGSYASGTQRAESDIDVALFIRKIDADYFPILKKLYSARRSIDVRIEPHLFAPGSDASGFSDEIQRTGIRL